MTTRNLLLLPVFILALFISLPQPISAGAVVEYPKLRDSVDPQLQLRLQHLLASRGLQKAVDQKRLAIALVDISDPMNPRMASVNGEVMKYAASLPKIAILLTAFVQIDEGKLELTEALEADMINMIRFSSNAAATRVLDIVGRDALLETIQSPRFMLYDKNYNGGLWVGKAYAKSGAYQRDPLHQISHGVSAIQAARYYYLLTTGQMLSPELTARMKEMLSQPAIAHKFVKGLTNYPEAKLYRKSGTWRHFHADSALVEYDDRSYIMVGLAEDPQGGRWLEKLAAPLQELVLEELPEE